MDNMDLAIKEVEKLIAEYENKLDEYEVEHRFLIRTSIGDLKALNDRLQYIKKFSETFWNLLTFTNIYIITMLD